MRISTFNQFERQAEMISIQYDKMSKLQQQIYTGKKLINSSDDPVLASQIKSTNDFMAQLQSYTNNGALVQGRGQLFESTIKSAITVSGDIQNILQRVQNGTASDTDKANFVKQLQGDLTTMLGLANTQDANGGYIYSGSHTNTSPYIQSGGSYQYQGGYDTTSVTIGLNVTALYNDSGFDAFGNIFTGNGTFTISAGSSNTGAASTSAGSVTSTSNYVPDTYTLTFGTNSSNQLVYGVVGTTSGQVIPPLPATFPNGAPVFNSGAQGVDISFNGLTFNVAGQPTSGDTFTIQPSTQQNAFNSIQNAINVLQNPGSNKAIATQNLNQAVSSISQVMNHLINYQSVLGQRNNSTSSQVQANTQLIQNQQIVLGNLSNADITQVFPQYQSQSIALQATQEGYLKMQDMLTELLKMASR